MHSPHLAWAGRLTERYLRRGGNFWPVEPVLARPHPPLVLSTATRQDIHLAPRLTLTLAPLAADRTPVAERTVSRYVRRDVAAGLGADSPVPIPGPGPVPGPTPMPGPAPRPGRGAAPPGGAGAPPPGYAPVPREVQRTGPSPHAGDGPVPVPGSPAEAGASWPGAAGPAPTLRPQDTERLTEELAQRLGDRLAGQLTGRVIRGLDRRQLARWERQAGGGEGGVG